MEPLGVEPKFEAYNVEAEAVRIVTDRAEKTIKKETAKTVAVVFPFVLFTSPRPYADMINKGSPC